MSKIKYINNLVNKFRYRSVEFNIDKYKPFLKRIEDQKADTMSDDEIKRLSSELIKRARNGVKEDDLLVEAYAIVREASYRTLNMRPFDVQVIAGIAMHEGNIVQMQTGEGKTLSAVFPAYLNALSGKGIHVLTFNDYLAQRDALWMGEVYKFLGLSVGFIKEGMTLKERQDAYKCDITYITAKEAGFDYLRGFTALNRHEILQRSFNFAIVDEADSILIDEARVPLVIAGKSESLDYDTTYLSKLIKGLKLGEDYETDENQRNVFFTEKGLNRVEKILNCGNLYEGNNVSQLVALNNALHAEVLLKCDVDYIVRNGKVELVDEFTGRVAENRQWPNGLQEAIEAKEEIINDASGQVITSVTLQNFIGMYSKVCGMTGTAVTSANELKEFYEINVVVIPTNKECIRVDHPDFLFTHKDAKLKALVDEIVNVNKFGRPVLIGTSSVEESEMLAEKLRGVGVLCRILNAKNDELEAHIIARAGELGAVTVSTNMAGRGTDIKLGGENEQDKDEVVALGGLYVIGTNRHESIRIDNQLRGRAGRQGDPGSTRFFTCLEDDLMKKYQIEKLIPEALYPKNQDTPLNNNMITKKVMDAQRIIEGQNFDIRRNLTKYSYIMEQQREMIYKSRMDVLMDEKPPQLMATRLSQRYSKLVKDIGEEAVKKAEKQISLHFINKCWSEYLDYMSYIKESIHLVHMAGKTPMDEFNRTAIDSFERLKQDIEEEIVNALSRVEITKDGVNMDKEGLRTPGATWTYIVDDRAEQLGMNPLSQNPIGALFSLPLWIGAAIYCKFAKKK